MQKSLLAPKRLVVQLLLLLIWIVMPLVNLAGNPFLRMDIAAHTLYLAGLTVRVEEFYLLLFLAMVSMLGFLLVTVLLGRVWCGWLCPQTLLNDLAGVLPEQFKWLKTSPRLGRISVQLVSILLSLLISAATIAYFMPYEDLFRQLSRPAGSPLLAITALLLALFVYFDLLFVGRSFCKSYCPYGRLQSAFMNDSTLNLVFCEEMRGQCIRCNSCVKVCPMGVDVRQGFQVECINCGRCLDACRTVMQRRSVGDGLIAYRFGEKASGSPRLSGSVIILLLLFALFSALLVYSSINRAEISFSVQRNPFISTGSLPDGTVIQAWNATLDNRSQKPAQLDIVLETGAPDGVRLAGQTTRIELAQNNNRQLLFFLHLPAHLPKGTEIGLLLLKADGTKAAGVKIRL